MKNSSTKIKIIIVLVIVVMCFFLLGAGEKEVERNKGTYKEGDNTNTPYVASKTVEEAISKTIDENTDITDLKTVASADGGYKLDINLDEITTQIIDTLYENNAGLEVYLSYGNMTEYMKKMIKAELITQYPDLRSAEKIGTPVTDESEFQGVIKFVRHNNDGTTKVLQYIPLGNVEGTDSSTLYGMINQANQNGSNSENILNYFSIDRDGNLIIVRRDKTITKTTSGSYETEYKSNNEEALYVATDRSYLDSAPEQVTYSYSKHSINYKDVMTQYTMPFEYLWAFLVTGKDEEFISDLADLVLESEIEVGIYEGQEINEELSINSYNTNNWEKNRKVEKILTKNIETGQYVETSSIVSQWSNPARITTTHNYEINYTKNIRDLLNIKVTKVDIWYMEATTIFTEKITEPSNSELVNYDVTRHIEIDEVLEDGNAPSENITYYEGTPRNVLQDETNILYRRTDYLRQSKKNQNMTVFASNSSRKEFVSEGTPQIKEKTDNSLREGDEGYPNFATLFMSSRSARNCLIGTESWLFEILASNETTVNMVEMTQYLLYRATSLDFGVKTFEFQLYNIQDFREVGESSVTALKQYIRYWEASGAAPMNADGTKYIIHDDGSGNPTVGYGIDIENSGYKQRFIDSGYTDLSIGAEIDVEFVDSLEEKKKQDDIEEIKSRLNGLELTDYQLNALLSRSYNCGVYGEPPANKPGALGPRNGKTFMEAYEVYWTEEDDLFGEKNASPNFNHSLYTTYMNVPVTSKDGYQPGLERRRKSEWALFQTGYYGYETNIDKWHPSGGAEIVDAAYRVADHFINSGVKVHYAGRSVYGVGHPKDNKRVCVFEDIEGAYTFPIQNPGKYGVVCATFVSLALRDAGIFDDNTINKYYYNSCGGVTDMLQDAGWQRITSYSELQPGDIWFEEGHVAIYVGDGKYIDQSYCVISSSGNDNREKFNTAKANNFMYAYRYST